MFIAQKFFKLTSRDPSDPLENMFITAVILLYDTHLHKQFHEENTWPPSDYKSMVVIKLFNIALSAWFMGSHSLSCSLSALVRILSSSLLIDFVIEPTEFSAINIPFRLLQSLLGAIPAIATGLSACLH